MGWWDRLGILVRAEAHGVVDAVEERRLLLKQYLREAEAELARKRASLEALEGERKELQRELKTHRRRIETLDEDAKRAMREEAEDLARFAIKKLIPLRRRSETIEDRLELLQKEREELAAVVTEQEAELETLRERVKAHLAQSQSGSVPGEICGWTVTDEEVELEMLRRREQESAGGAS